MSDRLAPPRSDRISTALLITIELRTMLAEPPLQRLTSICFRLTVVSGIASSLRGHCLDHNIAHWIATRADASAEVTAEGRKRTFVASG